MRPLSSAIFNVKSVGGSRNLTLKINGANFRFPISDFRFSAILSKINHLIWGIANLSSNLTKSLLLVLLATAFFSCGNSSEQNKEESETAQSEKRINKDSIRQLYHGYYAALEDTLPLQQIQEKGKLYPVDEAPKDTSFFVFREGLKKVVSDKDVFGLLDVVDKNIKASFGSENGLAAFVSMWNLDAKEPDSLQIWTILHEILSEGGVFKNDQKFFYAPYYYATWPGEYESFDYGAITGSGVRMRERTSLNSQILKTISYEIVLILEEAKIEEIGGEIYPWIKVELLDGTQGYVYGKFVGYPSSYRVGFEHKAEGWHMVLFVAGD